MKTLPTLLLLTVYFLATSHAWTCDQCGVKDCCSSSLCSSECRARGKNGGYCQYSSLENRCICYCYRDVGAGRMIAERMSPDEPFVMQPTPDHGPGTNKTSGCSYAYSNKCLPKNDCDAICGAIFPTSKPCFLKDGPGAQTGCCVCELNKECNGLCKEPGFWPCPVSCN